MGMSEAQIRAQQQELEARQKLLDEALSEARAEEVAALRDTIEEMADRRGMSFATFVQQNLVDAPKAPRKAVARDVKPKLYRNPNNHKEQWSGAGGAPAWFKAAMKAGATKQQLTIAYQDAMRSNGAHA